jgi:glycerol kinase
MAPGRHGRPSTHDRSSPAGLAEQDAEAIVVAVVEAVGEVLAAVGGTERITAAGLANQGETVVAWDRHSGAALAPAVLWSCRRSQAIVERIAAAGDGAWIRERPGLPLDPYLLGVEVSLAPRRATRGRPRGRGGPARVRGQSTRCSRLASEAVAAPGGGGPTARAPRSDPSTASRTQLFGLAELAWDDDLLRTWGVPRATLPTLVPTTGDLGGLAHPSWGGPIPLRAMVVRQQAALAGQGGHRPGTIKATFGTGVFVLANAGDAVPEPPDGIIATVAWGSPSGAGTYALDGGVFSAGAFLEWLHDDIGLLDARRDSMSSRRRCPTPAASGCCRRSAGWVRHGGTPPRAGPSAACRRPRDVRTSLGRRSIRSPNGPSTSWSR